MINPSCDDRLSTLEKICIVSAGVAAIATAVSAVAEAVGAVINAKSLAVESDTIEAVAGFIDEHSEDEAEETSDDT